MREDRSPFKDLALTEFQRQFGDLFSVKAEISDFERSIIEGTSELMWFENNEKRDSKVWGETLRAAYHFLERGFQCKSEKVAKVFFASINQVVPSMNNSVSKNKKAKKVKETKYDDKIEAYLSYYKTMYEGLVPVIAAPVVYSFAVARNISDPLFKCHSDGRISLGAIAKMEKWMIHPQNKLAIGLNHHIRNAFSHEKYRILDGGYVQLWDSDPRSKKTWGPEKWSLEGLENICDQLWYNSQAIVCAIALFSINYRKTMEARGWAHIKNSPPLRINELKSAIKEIASKHSLYLDDVTKEGEQLTIKLLTRLKGIDQDQEILVGSTPPRKFIKPIKYVEVRVIEHALGFLQAIVGLLDDTNYVSVLFADPDKNELGEISIERKNMSKIIGPKHSTVNVDRSVLDKDTIGDKTMWRCDEYPVYEV